MHLRILALLAALLLPFQVAAQDADATLDGHWALQIDDATIFVFMLDEGEDGTWQGSWTRPDTISSNGAVFRQMDGVQTVTPMETVKRRGVVQLTFEGPQSGGRRDVLRFSQTGENTAQLEYMGIPGQPYPLIRVHPDTPLGPFDPVRVYDRDNAVAEAEFVPREDGGDALETFDETDKMATPDAQADRIAAEGIALDEAATVDAEVDDEVSEEAEIEEPDEEPRIGADFLDGLEPAGAD